MRIFILLVLLLGCVPPAFSLSIVTRSQAFNVASRSLGDVGHTSTVDGATVTFEYFTVNGDFNDLLSYSFSPQTLKSLFGGTANAFGTYATTQAHTFGWSDQNHSSGFTAIQGHKLLPVAGVPKITISGKLEADGFFNSRPSNESSSIEWHLVHSADGSNASATMLDSGSFVVRRKSGTNQGELVSGDNVIDEVSVNNFSDGYIALWLKNSYNNAGLTGGHVNVQDQLTLTFDTTVPEPATFLLLFLSFGILAWRFC